MSLPKIQHRRPDVLRQINFNIYRWLAPSKELLGALLAGETR